MDKSTELAHLRETVARVKALLAEWERWVRPDNPPRDCADDLRRALDGESR